MKKRHIKMFVINIVVSVLSIVVLTMLGNSIIGTIVFAIWGEQNGLLATNIIIRILLPLFLALGIHLQNIRNEKEYNEYIAEMKEKRYEYSFKDDVILLIRNNDFWVEVGIFAFFSLVMMLVVQNPKWMFLLAIPLFVPINIFSHAMIHKSWIKRKTKI